MNAVTRDPDLERHALRRTVFETTDFDAGRSFIISTYRTSLRLKRGSERDQSVKHARHDFGDFCVDELSLPMEAGYDIEPLGSLTVVQPIAGWVDHRWEESSENTGPGDVAVISPPHRPFSVTLHNLASGTVVLHQPLLMRAAGFPEDEPDSSLRFSGTQPASTELAGGWRHAVSCVRQVLSARPEVLGEPLVVGNLARGLATTALETFPNTGGPEPTSADGGDATAAAVSRAVAFIEENAHTDISLADIAAAARVTPRSLRIAFARHHRSSIFGCVRSVRLERAHFDLLAVHADIPGAPDGETVAAVGARWGFANPADFAASYHHAYGVSPEEILPA
ncbi:AraC family transcriptional regulator [Streptomyces sp. WMMB 322]|uniref:helix-turn-helix domain-containing protein n=1 Tax=Streptomyces sp. WMMB 322 TaxID=1286821 RepID=UPI0006E24572|nr:AraC family transcriptional regulator [Streptomyces sp. WMMB 322]SCK45819.1 AraC-type DNA-binding protein [Streptomyces sp. WMMB 322]